MYQSNCPHLALEEEGGALGLGVQEGLDAGPVDCKNDESLESWQVWWNDPIPVVHARPSYQMALNTKFVG